MNNLVPIIDPIVLSTTFSQTIPSQGGYSRIDNSSRLHLEKALSRLEKARFGLAFSSGSTAIATVFSSLKAGDHIICHEEIYEGTLRLLQNVFKKFGINFSLINLSELEFVRKAIKKNTKIIFLENMTNPTLKVIDVKKISQLVGDRDIIIVVDNTFITPVFCNPLNDGADMVVHSLTKFIAGHHDVTAGAIMINNQTLFNELKSLQQTIGAVPSPFDCFLIKRGIETLNVRMFKHQETAGIIFNFLKDQKQIKTIIFPHVSGLIAIWIKGNKRETIQFLQRLKLIKIAHSLGGTVSTILHPSSMMTFSLSEAEKQKLGITDNLLRLSIGLEDAESLIKDLQFALNHI